MTMPNDLSVQVVKHVNTLIKQSTDERWEILKIQVQAQGVKLG